MNRETFVGAVSSLGESKISEHFVVRYAVRNPAQGRGGGTHGIRDRKVVDVYVEALEAAYAVLRAGPWNRPPPVRGSIGKTLVYLCDLVSVGLGSPLTAMDRARVPFIALPSRSYEITAA